MSIRRRSGATLAGLALAVATGCGGAADVRQAVPISTSTPDGWNALTAFAAGGGAFEGEVYKDLPSLVRGADLVVLASLEPSATRVAVIPQAEGPPKFATLRPGEAAPGGAMPQPRLRLRVLDGSPDLGPGDVVELDAFGVDVTGELLERTTDHALVFLHRRDDTGGYRLVWSRALLVDRDGRASMAVEEIAEASTADASLSRLGHGEEFDELLAEVRAARSAS